MGASSYLFGSVKIMKMIIDPANPRTWPKGRVDAVRLDATTETELAAQQASDDASAMQDAARYARRVRQRLGLTQQELSQRIDVSLEPSAIGRKANAADWGGESFIED